MMQCAQRFRFSLFFVVLLLVSIQSRVSFASDDLYVFHNTAQSEQFSRLNNELRCMVCQNQTIADSNATLANDLRNEVYSFVMAGKSDQEIKQYLVARYGDFVLFKPPVKLSTLFLWALPFLMFFCVIMIVVRVVRQQKHPNLNEAS